MLSTEDVKRLLQDDKIADDEALAIRDACYELAGIIIAQWRVSQQALWPRDKQEIMDIVN